MAKFNEKYGLSVRIDKTIIEKLKVIAIREKRSLKAVIEMALEDKLNECPTLNKLN